MKIKTNIKAGQKTGPGGGGLFPPRPGGSRRHFRVLGHQPEERGAPGSEGDDVDEGERGDVDPVEEVGPEGHGPAVVMGHDVGRIELPLLDQRGQQLPLGPERDVTVGLVRLAVADHVPGEHRPVGGQGVDDRAPHEARPWGAMAQHHGGTVPEAAVADDAAVPLERLGQGRWLVLHSIRP